MARPDLGVGPSVKFAPFENRGVPLDILADRDSLNPLFRKLLTIGNPRNLQTESDYLRARRLADNALFTFVQPVWGERLGCQRPLKETTKEVEKGVNIGTTNGGDLFVGSTDATLEFGFAHGGLVFTRSHRPRIREAVISGRVVFGTASGSNDPGLEADQLAVITDIADAIEGNNKTAIDTGLTHLTGMLTPDERQHEGYIKNGDTTYAAYKENMGAAKVFDTFYLPWLLENYSQDIFVQGSLVHSFKTAFGGVLGRTVRDSAIVTNGAEFPNAHLEIYNTVIRSASGFEYVEHTTKGNPSNARAAIEAAQQLKPLPLATFAA